MDSTGDFVDYWESRRRRKRLPGICCIASGAAGPLREPSFQINGCTLVLKIAAAVMMDSAGDFVIVWESANEEGSGEGVYARQYNASGSVQGVEFTPSNAFTTGNSGRPLCVAMDAAGDFVVVWQRVTPRTATVMESSPSVTTWRGQRKEVRTRSMPVIRRVMSYQPELAMDY